jgi:hypothetical protein
MPHEPGMEELAEPLGRREVETAQLAFALDLG